MVCLLNGQVKDLSYLRLRKEGGGDFQYSGGMDSVLDANWTAAQVMKVYPQTASVFLELKTDCVGCHLGKFCTLVEVAAAYELPLERLLHKLREAVQNSTTRGEKT